MKKIGVIGFGIVGKSVLKFLKKIGLSSNSIETFRLSVWDERDLNIQEKELIQKSDAVFFDYEKRSLGDFFEQHDFVIPSPGFDLRLYQKYHNKIISELDLFSAFFTKPTIAITGSLGKTTITSLLTTLITDSIMAGNVGTGMLDLVTEQNRISCAILELSSFQLEYSHHFAPHVSILTNIYPNHLNRHSSTEKYIEAKWNLFVNQDESQYTFLPLNVINNYPNYFIPKLKVLKSKCSFIAYDIPTKRDLSLSCFENKTIFYCAEKSFCKANISCGKLIKSQILFDMSNLPDITFEQNWVSVLSVLYVYGICLKKISFDIEKNKTLFGGHRLEYVATINGADFYNDSKATVIQATQAAVEKLSQSGRPQIVIVGGLAKGVDRTPLINFLNETKNIKKIICFGSQCTDLSAHFHSYPSLESLLNDIMRIIEPNDQVLFSPGGASFDLFDNYMHRGDVFKQLVLRFYKSSKGDGWRMLNKAH